MSKTRTVLFLVAAISSFAYGVAELVMLWTDREGVVRDFWARGMCWLFMANWIRTAMAAKYGVAVSTIQNIRARNSWAWMAEAGT